MDSSCTQDTTNCTFDGSSSGSGSGGDDSPTSDPEPGGSDCVQACHDWAATVNACIEGLGATATDYSATCNALQGACGAADYAGYYSCLAASTDPETCTQNTTECSF